MLIRSLSLGTWMVGLVMVLSAAHGETIPTCTLKGKIVLKESTQILCVGDLKVEGRARILTQGFSLMVIVSGNVDFSKGLDIVAYDSSMNNGSDGGSILIAATTASGYLRIDNQGFTSANAPGGIDIEYVALNGYDHDIYVDSLTHVGLVLNGYEAEHKDATLKFGNLIHY